MLGTPCSCSIGLTLDGFFNNPAQTQSVETGSSFFGHSSYCVISLKENNRS